MQSTLSRMNWGHPCSSSITYAGFLNWDIHTYHNHNQLISYALLLHKLPSLLHKSTCSYLLRQEDNTKHTCKCVMWYLVCKRKLHSYVCSITPSRNGLLIKENLPKNLCAGSDSLSGDVEHKSCWPHPILQMILSLLTFCTGICSIKI